jgi:chemotaxis protein MotB
VSEQAPVVIVRKKAGHGGHHGGAWKVAYADFVTAMMALFIVLWLMNANEDVKKAVSIYFNDPTGTGNLQGSNMAGSGETVSVGEQDMNKLKEKLDAAVKKSPEFDKLKNHIKMTVTGEGLRIELSESANGVFFESGSPKPSEVGKNVVAMLAGELAKMPNQLLIEGHTDSSPYNSASYSNWELSADRANMARRVMMEHGLRADQVVQVRGFADQQLRNKDNPEDPANRRVSVIVKYQAPTPKDVEEEKAKGAKAGHEAKAGGHEAQPSGHEAQASGHQAKPDAHSAAPAAQEPAKADVHGSSPQKQPEAAHH